MRIWAWPTEAELLIRPKEWRDTSPADADKLADALVGYIERPWLQHDVIDGAAINALLFAALAEYTDLHMIRVFGLSYGLSGGNQLRMLWINPLVKFGWFLVRWIMPPAMAWGLNTVGYEGAASVVLGLWLIYLLYRMVIIPVRWVRRNTRRKTEAKAAEPIAATKKAWQYSSDAVINPSRLRQLLLAAEQGGAVFKPVLHTLIDRAIQRDPTALSTRRTTAIS
jgi:hypothetical protein